MSFKAFQELQSKVITTTAQVKVAEAQIAQLQRTIQIANLTKHEISQLPLETKTYESVGRMYVFLYLSHIHNVSEGF